MSSIMHCCLARTGVRNTKTLTAVVGWILNNAGNVVMVGSHYNIYCKMELSELGTKLSI